MYPVLRRVHERHEFGEAVAKITEIVIVQDLESIAEVFDYVPDDIRDTEKSEAELFRLLYRKSQTKYIFFSDAI